MRGPLENLLLDVARELDVHLVPHGEASLSALGIRPDYAIEIDKAVIGYLEVKAPGKGADPTRWPKNGHDHKQWLKLTVLPNVLYTDGQEWALYRGGERVGQLVRLPGHIADAGAALVPTDGELARILSTFLRWAPIPPRTISGLVTSVAGLCRLLRDEVSEALSAEESASAALSAFTTIARDWRQLLFPEATDAEFADQYAQTVTFALLLARIDEIDFTGRSLHDIATHLGRRHSLMGRALSVMTDESVGRLAVTLDTLVRVIAVVEWSAISRKGDAYAALHLYEQFLEVYDPALRKKSGSYYTPADIVSCMVRLTDTLLRERLDKPAGFASEGVITIDPAMGTGTYLLNILETAATTIAQEQGAGAVAPALRALARRLIGFEKQTGPYAVAEMRVMQTLLGAPGAKTGSAKPRLYVADTLEDPWRDVASLGSVYEPIAQSRRSANTVKRTEQVLVVIGNPPYREQAKAVGGWVVNGRPNDPKGDWRPLDDFRAKGLGRYEQNLNNLYVYFWRWALWKVFEAHDTAQAGVVAFITTSGYLTGPGFAGMREHLRRTADEGWIIDLSPEGHRPDVSTRVFQGVQQSLAIGIFVRNGPPQPDRPAALHHITLAGHREEKFTRLRSLTFDDPAWAPTSIGWQEPLTPARGDAWSAMPTLADLFPWSSSGVTANRSWPYAHDPDLLRRRWRSLVSAAEDRRATLLKTTRDRDIYRKFTGLPGFTQRLRPLAEETGPCPDPVPIAFRSFDVQYVIPDVRVLDMPRPDLWSMDGPKQIFATELRSAAPLVGPPVTFAAYLPELHHLRGNNGGRVVPTWLDGQASIANCPTGLLHYLAQILDVDITAPDLMAYIAAITAHSGYTETYRTDLSGTGSLRVPITANPVHWSEAVELGKHVLWLHTGGQRHVEARAERAGRPRLPLESRPKVVTAIPDSCEEMPDNLRYDADTQTLHVGGGAISPVSRQVWEYQVSGMRIVRKWFGYRKKTPATKWSSPLSDITADHWRSQDTSDLLDLINVLGLVVTLEPLQATLLDRIRGGKLITLDDMVSAGVLDSSVLPTESHLGAHVLF